MIKNTIIAIAVIKLLIQVLDHGERNGWLTEWFPLILVGIVSGSILTFIDAIKVNRKENKPNNIRINRKEQS